MSWSVLITGSNRGIGLGLVKYFLNHEDPPTILIATCRNPDSATELQELKKKHKNLYLLALDVTAFDTFPEVAKKVESIVGKNGLNVLINNAGISAGMESLGALENMVPETYQKVYNTNTLGPVFFTKAMLPLLERASNVNKDKPVGIKRASIINISSTLGSVTLNDGSVYKYTVWAYRESKSALNQFSRTLAGEVESKGITVTVFCPGHVQTDMGGKEAPLTVDDSISSLIKVIYSIDKSKHNRYFQHTGKEIPW